MRVPKSGGGWQAVRYTFKKGREVGTLRLLKAMQSKNACKTCALGMGGQEGGMRNEKGHFPEVCKKSLQAMAADMQGGIGPEFWSTYSIEQLRTLSPRELESMGRLTQPIKASPGDTHYSPITWDEALAHVSQALAKSDPARSFFYASGRSSNEAGFLLQVFARCYGTNNVSNCSYYCHQASGVGLKDAIGVSTATVVLDDLDECDLFFLIGGNPASNHPRLMTTLMKVRERGGHVVAINPIKETGLINFKVPSNLRSMLFGSEIASHYLQPKIGGDISVLAGMLKHLTEVGLIESDFIHDHTHGFEEVLEYVNGLEWPEIESASGLSRTQIQEVADLYGRSKGTVFAWTMGVTHHLHGVENVHWISNLALARGMVGKPGAGLLPIRGHSNVQGMGTMGVSPTLTQAAIERLADLGVSVPKKEGRDTLATLEAAFRSELDFGLCLGGNLYGASPDSTFTGKALGNLETLVYLSTTLNTGHAHGLGKTTLVLPVLARDEEPQSTTQESMFSFVRLSSGGRARHEGPRSESSVISALAQKVLPMHEPLDWQKLEDHDEIRALVARLVPSLEPIKDIGHTKQEFHIPGRHFPSASFATSDGKAMFFADPVPAQRPLLENELLLMTIRSEGQFNTVVYEDHDIYRGQDRRDVILLNENDIQRLRMQSDQFVDVSSASGVMRRIRVRPFDIASDCAAMYYPECNLLVGRENDPRSKTPAFKSVRVIVTPHPLAK